MTIGRQLSGGALGSTTDPDGPDAFASGTTTAEAGLFQASPASLGAVPAATTVALGGATFDLDCTGRDRVRLAGQFTTLGPALSVVGLQGSADGGSSWVWADDGTAVGGDLGSHAPQLALDASGEQRSAWATLHTSLQGPARFRFVTDNGNGVATPTARRLQAQAGTA